MDNTADIFVNEKSFKIITDQLGYIPDNLGISSFVEDSKAIVLNTKSWNELRKKLYEPMFK